MKISSPILFRLGLASLAVELDGSEQAVHVPHVLVPTIEVPDPITAVETSLVTALYRRSFFQTRRLGNSGIAAAFTEVLVNLARGLWDLQFLLSAVSNFTTADFIVDAGCRIQLLDNDGTIANILEHELVANVPAYLSTRHVWLIEEDTWVIRASVPVTAAGQLVVCMFGVRGNRLH